MSDDVSMSHENDIDHHILVRGPIAAAMQLQRKLPIDEFGFLSVAGNSHADARAYYLYAAMDEIARAAIALARLPPEVHASRVSEPGKANAAGYDHSARLTLESIRDELQLWARKCIEVIVDLVLFSTTNEQEMYRLYILSRQLELCLSSDLDRARYYLGAGGDGGSFISLVRAQISAAEQQIDRSKAWFLNKTDLNTTKRPNFMESFSGKFARCMEVADDTVKYLVSPSYRTAYSLPSSAVHGGIDPLPPIRISLDDLRRLRSRVGMLGICATRLAFRLADQPAHGEVAQIFTSLDRSVLPSLLRDTLQPHFSNGDIVVSDHTRIGIIVCMRTSAHGNTVFDVEWAGSPPPAPVSSIEGYRLQLLMGSIDIPVALANVLRESDCSDDAINSLLSRPSIELARRMAASALRLYAKEDKSDVEE